MISKEDKNDVKRIFGKKTANAVANATKDKGFDGKKRWGNSAVKGYGVNSPAMMDARNKAIHAKAGAKKESKKDYTKRHFADILKYETN